MLSFVCQELKISVARLFLLILFQVLSKIIAMTNVEGGEFENHGQGGFSILEAQLALKLNKLSPEQRLALLNLCPPEVNDFFIRASKEYPDPKRAMAAYETRMEMDRIARLKEGEKRDRLKPWEWPLVGVMVAGIAAYAAGNLAIRGVSRFTKTIGRKLHR